MLLFDEAIAHFLLYCDQEKRLARTTLTTYTNRMKLFTVYMAAHHPGIAVEEVTLPILRGFLRAQHFDGESASTGRDRVMVVRSFFRYCEEQEEIVWPRGNPTRKLPTPKVQARELRLPSIREIADVLSFLDYYVLDAHVERARNEGRAVLDTDARVWLDARNRIVIWTPLLCGLRASELIGLDWRDITLTGTNPRILIRHAKGDKQRTVPLPPDLVEMLVTLRTLEEARGRGRDTDAVVASLHNGRLSYGALRLIVSGLLDGKLTAKPHIAPHDLRRICISDLADSKVQPRYIQSLAGHASLNTTMRYMRVDDAEIRKGVEGSTLARSLNRKRERAKPRPIRPLTTDQNAL